MNSSGVLTWHWYCLINRAVSTVAGGKLNLRPILKCWKHLLRSLRAAHSLSSNWAAERLLRVWNADRKPFKSPISASKMLLIGVCLNFVCKFTASVSPSFSSILLDFKLFGKFSQLLNHFYTLGIEESREFECFQAWTHSALERLCKRRHLRTDFFELRACFEWPCLESSRNFRIAPELRDRSHANRE